jgi:transcription elongation factor GreA-like protein
MPSRENLDKLDAEHLHDLGDHLVPTVILNEDFKRWKRYVHARLKSGRKDVAIENAKESYTRKCRCWVAPL